MSNLANILNRANEIPSASAKSNNEEKAKRNNKKLFSFSDSEAKQLEELTKLLKTGSNAATVRHALKELARRNGI